METGCWGCSGWLTLTPRPCQLSYLICRPWQQLFGREGMDVWLLHLPSPHNSWHVPEMCRAFPPPSSPGRCRLLLECDLSSVPASSPSNAEQKPGSAQQPFPGMYGKRVRLFLGALGTTSIPALLLKDAHSQWEREEEAAAGSHSIFRVKSQEKVKNPLEKK